PGTRLPRRPVARVFRPTFRRVSSRKFLLMRHHRFRGGTHSRAVTFYGQRSRARSCPTASGPRRLSNEIAKYGKLSGGPFLNASDAKERTCHLHKFRRSRIWITANSWLAITETNSRGFPAYIHQAGEFMLAMWRSSTSSQMELFPSLRPFGNVA